MIDVYVTGSSVDIGRQGENNARNVYFDLTDLTTDYGEGTATLVHMRPSDQAPYICETETDGSYLVWTPSSTDTAYSGAGKCELRWVVGDTLAKSIIYTTTIAPSITGDSVIPDPYQSWYEALLEHISEYEIASDQIEANTRNIATNTNDIAVLDGRVDELTTLPEGSTTGDAELADIRVGANGTVYPNAGDAVREQVNDLKSVLESYINDILYCKPFVANSYVDRAGTIKPYNGWTRTGYLDVSKFYSITVKSSVASSYNCFYDANQTFSSYFNVGTVESTIIIPQGVQYVIFSNTAAGMYNLTVTYVTKEDKALADTESSVEHLNAQNATLSESVAQSLAFGDAVYKSMFDTNATVESGGLATTRRWFINRIFPAGTKIDRLDFSYSRYSTVNRVVYVEIWEKVGDTLTKVKTVATNITQTTAVYEIAIASVVMDYECTNPCMVCILTTGTSSSVLYTAESTQHNRVIVSTNVSVDATTIAYSSLTAFTAMNILPSSKLFYITTTANVVTIGDGMDYAEIQEALESISDDAVDNPYTFWIMPRKTPYKRFSTIRHLSDQYVTSGRIRYISMIGLDKAHCVIQSDSGDYKEPCGELLIDGILSNLTFKMTNDEQTATAEKGGYCLHIDFEPNPSASCNMVIENCDFEDASAPCLGIGLRQNMTLTIRDCNLHTTLAANYAPHEGYRNLYTYGCLFAHTNSGATTQGQRLIIDGCTGICESGARSLNLIHAGDYDQSTADFKYALMRNVFWNMSANAPGYYIDSDLTAMPYNFGNNNA